MIKCTSCEKDFVYECVCDFTDVDPKLLPCKLCGLDIIKECQCDESYDDACELESKLLELEEEKEKKEKKEKKKKPAKKCKTCGLFACFCNLAAPCAICGHGSLFCECEGVKKTCELCGLVPLLCDCGDPSESELAYIEQLFTELKCEHGTSKTSKCWYCDSGGEIHKVAIHPMTISPQSTKVWINKESCLVFPVSSKLNVFQEESGKGPEFTLYYNPDTGKVHTEEQWKELGKILQQLQQTKSMLYAEQKGIQTKIAAGEEKYFKIVAHIEERDQEWMNALAESQTELKDAEGRAKFYRANLLEAAESVQSILSNPETGVLERVEKLGQMLLDVMNEINTTEIKMTPLSEFLKGGSSPEAAQPTPEASQGPKPV